ncbi:MAG TPA: hypothetical protein VNT02_12935, partial [Burkholderiales bacterium]|nr:hypothetical protein [Burkholderiales bacterium]
MPSLHRLSAPALVLLSACATITADEMQPISITINDDNGKLVEQTRCVVKNDKGVWEMDAPGFVSVHRSSRDLLVECRKEGFPDGQARAISRAGGGMFGNIIFGGGIGAIIDHAQGTGYNY